jgi:hypothetical protein
VFRRLKLSWARAKALSVLQTAYEMPLANPRDPLDETDLRLTTELTFDSGGNAFDAAAAFMTSRIKSALRANIELGKSVDEAEDDARKLVAGLARTRGFMHFYKVHIEALSEITELRARIRVRDESRG